VKGQLEEFSGALSPELLQRAYMAGNELAWTRRDAVDAIDGLLEAGFVLLGVEVWIPTSPGPTMTDWGWDSRDASVSGWAQSAREFVESFKWGPDDGALRAREPYFNLTTAEKQPRG
jgi:hypothetical protein